MDKPVCNLTGALRCFDADGKGGNQGSGKSYRYVMKLYNWALMY